MSSTRTQKYQEGSIDRVARAKGPDVWVYRWRESTTPDGPRVQRKRVIGDLTRYPTESAAKRAVENLRAEINTAQDRIGQSTIRQVWGHFETHELRDPDVDRSPTTIELYLDNFRIHIIPRWGDTYLTDVKAVAVEKWLRSLPLAPATKSKLRNNMSALYNHAIRHELHDRANPITAVRQGAKRVKIPDILTTQELQVILAGVPEEIHRMAILVAAITGLRRSEIRGLKWSDVDTARLWLSLRRGIVRGLETKLKTEASRKGIPIPRDLAEALDNWRSTSMYRADGDWVFASPATGGRTPLWLDIVLQRHIRPVAKTAGITKTIGWHTFRRSLASLLARSGEDVKVVQELLRHANASTTMELYQQAYADDKRAAQASVSNLFLVTKAS